MDNRRVKFPTVLSSTEARPRGRRATSVPRHQAGDTFGAMLRSPGPPSWRVPRLASQCLVASIVVVVSLVASRVAAEPTPAVIPPAADAALGQQVPVFTATLLDVSTDPPKTREIDTSHHDRVTAFVFFATRCPASLAYAPRFQAIEQRFAGQGLQVIYIYPNREESLELKVAFHRREKLGGPLVHDEGARLARLFKAARTSEVFLADKRGRIVYHGALDDHRDIAKVKVPYLENAIAETLAGKPVSIGHSQVFACGIHF